MVTVIVLVVLLILVVMILPEPEKSEDHTCSFCGGNKSFKFGRKGGCNCWHGSD